VFLNDFGCYFHISLATGGTLGGIENRFILLNPVKNHGPAHCRQGCYWLADI